MNNNINNSNPLRYKKFQNVIHQGKAEGKLGFTENVQIGKTKKGDLLHLKKETNLSALKKFGSRTVRKVEDQIATKIGRRKTGDHEESFQKKLNYNKSSKRLYDFIAEQKGQSVADELLKRDFFRNKTWNKIELQKLNNEAETIKLLQDIEGALSLTSLKAIKYNLEKLKDNPNALKPGYYEFLEQKIEEKIKEKTEGEVKEKKMSE